MPTSRQAVWRDIGDRYGVDIPTLTRVQCEESGLVDAVLHSTGKQQSRAYTALAAAALGLTASPQAEYRPRRHSDPRWTLWSDLSEAAGSDLWEPLVIQGSESTRTAVGGAPVARVQSLTVTFDGRMPLDDLIDRLRRMWPVLRRAGWIRATRRLAPQTVALVRFVCLETDPTDSWESRWKRWQARNRRKGSGWTFADRRAFSRNFHRAERSLTGMARGLAWFYDPMARLSAAELVRAGNEPATRELNRRNDLRMDVLRQVIKQLDQEGVRTDG